MYGHLFFVKFNILGIELRLKLILFHEPALNFDSLILSQHPRPRTRSLLYKVSKDSSQGQPPLHHHPTSSITSQPS